MRGNSEVKEVRDVKQSHSEAFQKYKQALGSAGPRLTELILHRAEQEANITFDEFVALCKIAYPEE